MTDENGTNEQITDQTVSELEAQARAKVTAEQEASAPDNDTKAGTPEVNRLKPRRQNRLLFTLIAGLVILVILAWAGDWFYRNFLKSDNGNAETASLGTSNAPVQRRSGMGGESKPFFTEEPATGLPEAQSTVTFDERPTPSFNKIHALVGDGTTSASGQKTAISRVNERSINVEATTTSSLPLEVKSNVTRIQLNPDLYVAENTYIPCVMQTRFVSDVAGRISCNLSEDVYSANGHTLLIEKGTKAKGVYKTGTLKAGQSRMFIVWTELRTPGGKKIMLVDTQVVGQLGEAGIDGWIDTHFWERFGNALMLSTVSDVAAAAADSAPGKDRNTDYTENTRAAAAEMAKIALENSINIPPTIYKNHGDIIGMLVGEDIDFSSIYRLRMK